ncbi:MAG: hypothetical protein KGY80_05950 [Candidatus Thorarchaeota archaeon]|nr:hypothetical protein [Candidatus Thorarchaeota archaeon]
MRSRYDSQVSYIQPPFNCKKQAIDKAVVCLKISWQPKRIESMSNHRPFLEEMRTNTGKIEK